MKNMAKESALALILAVAVYAAFDAGLGMYLERRELEHQVARLEMEADYLRQMTADAVHLFNVLERPVLLMETDYTTREFLWLMADVFRKAGVPVVIE